MLQYRVDDNRDIGVTPLAAVVPSTFIDVARSKFSKVMNICLLLGLHKDAQTEHFPTPAEVTGHYLARYLSILAATKQMIRLVHEYSNDDYENIFRF